MMGDDKKRSAIESWCVTRICTAILKERKYMKQSAFNKVSEVLYLWFHQKEKIEHPFPDQY